MPVKKVNLNTTYISERVSNCLSSISCCALTTVIAPMGYGKTTAIQWYLNRCARTEKARVIRVSIYSPFSGRACRTLSPSPVWMC